MAFIVETKFVSGHDSQEDTKITIFQAILKVESI